MPQRRRVLFLLAQNVHALPEGVVAYAHKANWILDNMMAYSGVLPHGKRADGALCRHSFRQDIIDFTRALDVPTVGFEHVDVLPLPRVYYNEELIGRRAARHLLERGHRTLAFYHRGWTPFQLQRMEGFQAEAEAAEEIAVVSAENDPMLCESGAIPVSSVETCTWKLGYESARLLDELMDGVPPPEMPRRIDPGEVETRASSDLVAVPNLHAARALRFIWSHYSEPINVERVSEHVSVTRRRLQTLFHDHVGRTMQDEIARIRTAKACSLLKHSQMKIHEVAVAVGFSSSLHLHRTFQSALHMGPKAFRDQGEIPDFGILPACTA